MLNSLTFRRGHQGTCPGESTVRALMVASECAHAPRYRSMISSRVSCSVTHIEFCHTCSSSHGGKGSGYGRSKTSPRYRDSVCVRCLTRPRRLVPVAVRGRRMSYSDSPWSFHNITSRASRRSLCRYSFAKSSITENQPAIRRRWTCEDNRIEGVVVFETVLHIRPREAVVHISVLDHEPVVLPVAMWVVGGYFFGACGDGIFGCGTWGNGTRTRPASSR